jgi:hypothetical protein
MPLTEPSLLSRGTHGSSQVASETKAWAILYNRETSAYSTVKLALRTAVLCPVASLA